MKNTNYFECFFFQNHYVSKQTFSTNQFKKTVTEKWTKGSLEDNVQQYIQTLDSYVIRKFKFRSDLFDSPIRSDKKEQGAGREYPMV